MRTCFVPFCDVKNKDQPNRTMFLAPKERKLFAQWSNALPKVRELKSSDKVCYIHFKPDEVLNTFDHIINGQVIKIKRDRPRLKPNAIPCLEMTTKDEEWLSCRAKSRASNQSKHIKINNNTEKIVKLNLNMGEPEEVNDPVNIYVEVQNEEEEEVSEIENVSDLEGHELVKTEKSDSKIEDVLVKEINSDPNRRWSPINNVINKDSTFTELTSLFNFLYENVYEILMPSTLWGIHRCPHRSFVCFSCVDAFKMQVIKMLVVRDDGSIQLLVDGNVKTLHLLHDIDDLDSLPILLNKMDVGHLCFGKSTNINCEFMVEPNGGNCWITDDNQQVFLCKFCLPQN